MLLTSANPPEGFLVVKSLKEAASEWSAYDCVMTIESPGFDGGLRIPATAKTRQHVVQFDDTDLDQGRGRAATVDEVREMLLLAREYRNAKLMVHCLQGQSRSAAVALGVVSDRIGRGREDEAVEILMRMRPTAVCNTIVLDLVDGLLGRDGALKNAWQRQLAVNDRAAGVMLLRELAARQG